MPKSKITVVGAGNVGATTAHIAACQQLGDIVLLDIVDGLPQGKALDMACASPVYGTGQHITGTTNWADTAGSDVVIITSGVPRKPGMSRDDLLATNTKIVKSVCENVVRYSPNSTVIVVCNPLDAMVAVAAKVTGFPSNRVMGMAGALDAARYTTFLANEINVNVADIQCVLMGGHGDDMVPLPRYTCVRGIPISQFVTQDKLDAIVQRARKGGIEVVNLMGTSAYYAPAAGAVKMAEAILKDQKAVFCCCAYCDTEFNAGGCFVGVPAILGANGVEKIIELDLNDDEKTAFKASLDHVKELVQVVEKFM